MRLSVTKYVKTGICKTVHEAVDKLFTDHLDKFFSEFDSNFFRQNKLWSEECDKIFKRNMANIKAIYKLYSGRYSMPGQPRHISVEEFYQCIIDSGVVNEHFGEREIKPIYSVSMMTQKDELATDKL